ncbi:MAG: DUF1565 domain-containing protein [Pseudomonadota bacterium]
MLKHWLRITWIATALAAGTASGATWFVEQATGSDANDGMQPETAFATITRALEVAGDTDTIIVGIGVYAPTSGEVLPLESFEQSLTIEGAGERLTVIDGEATAQVLNLNIGDGNTVRLANLAIINGASAIGAGLFVGEPGRLEVERVRFAGNDGSIGGALHLQINQDQNADVSVLDCTFEDNSAAIGPGLHVQQNGAGEHAVLVERSVFRRHDDEAVVVSRNDGGGLVTLRSSIIDAADQGGVRSSQTGVAIINSTLVGTRELVNANADLEIINSILVVEEESGDGGGDGGGRPDDKGGTRVVGGSGGLVRDSIVRPLDVGSHTVGDNVIDDDPLLTASLRLTVASPALDRGDDTVVGSDARDVDGDARILGTASAGGAGGLVDLGADEFDAATIFHDGFEEE